MFTKMVSEAWSLLRQIHFAFNRTDPDQCKTKLASTLHYQTNEQAKIDCHKFTHQCTRHKQQSILLSHSKTFNTQNTVNHLTLVALCNYVHRNSPSLTYIIHDNSITRFAFKCESHLHTMTRSSVYFMF